MLFCIGPRILINKPLKSVSATKSVAFTRNRFTRRLVGEMYRGSMEFTDIFSFFPIFAGTLGLLAFYKNGKAIRQVSDQSIYHNLDGKKLRYRSGELNGMEHGWCFEFLVAKEVLGLRCSRPAFNYVANYDQIQVSKSKEIIGHRVCLTLPEIGQLKISERLANRINEISNGKLYGNFT